MSTVNTEVLRKKRKSKDVSAKHLANAIGKSEDMYRKKERGYCPTTTDEVVAIADALNLSLKEINEIFLGNGLHKRN